MTKPAFGERTGMFSDLTLHSESEWERLETGQYTFDDRTPCLASEHERSVTEPHVCPAKRSIQRLNPVFGE